MDERKLKHEQKLKSLTNVKVLTPLNASVKDEQKEKVKKEVKPSLQTSPISKRLVEFHHEQIGKFSVKDLFKK